MNLSRHRERLFATPDELALALSHRIGAAAQAAITERGSFSLVLTGGRTVVPIFTHLKTLQTAWPVWHIYWGDERCVPVDHPERNSRQARSAWLDSVPIRPENIHQIPVEIGATEAACCYEQLLKQADTFDFVLLSLGEDGHVASIFPGREEQRQRSVFVVPDAPKPPPCRVSLSLHRLAQNRELALLATGKGKHGAVTALRAAAASPATALSRLTSLTLYLHDERY